MNYEQRVIDKLYSKIDKQTDGCWLWMGKWNGGAPTFSIGGKANRRCYMVRRMLCELLGKPVAIFHKWPMKCKNEECVNPEHMATTDAERFWVNVEKTDECWLWTSFKDKNGYGKFKLLEVEEHQDVRAHRYAYVLQNGPITDSTLCVCHTCDTVGCVRGEHLWLGTNAENTADKMLKQRQARGDTHGSSKLTEERVRNIRANCNLLELAKRFGVHPRCILGILTGETWRHVEP
jgi:hypothetical protein